MFMHPFDTLAYSKRLIKSGFTQEQAEGLAWLAREQYDVCQGELQKLKAEIMEEIHARRSIRNGQNVPEQDMLATRSDVADVRLEIEKVRGEVEKLRSDIRTGETRIILWVAGIMGTAFAGLVCVMAKGFGWLG